MALCRAAQHQQACVCAALRRPHSRFRRPIGAVGPGGGRMRYSAAHAGSSPAAAGASFGGDAADLLDGDPTVTVHQEPAVHGDGTRVDGWYSG